MAKDENFILDLKVKQKPLGESVLSSLKIYF